ncbi:copper chaperone PCu(A)C [Sphingomonas sp. Leaf23]|uniref:copper chaperone PCu(A)C n=1 Tax=Sphingomonas sp. Leaf23 TaxID=1735689 RepID=UPI0009E997EE|nr:copper chaperone PCu(A)C [Sphingomonas sp. Leaf23]
MKTRWMVLAGLFPLIVVGGCSQPAEKGIVVEDAWVRLPAVPGRPAAGYATIKGDTGTFSAMLRGAASPKAQKIELHVTMTMGEKMVGMKPIAQIPVPPNTTLFLKPGSAHMMMFGVASELKPGDTMPITFQFDTGAKTVDAKLVGAGDPAPQ